MIPVDYTYVRAKFKYNPETGLLLKRKASREWFYSDYAMNRWNLRINQPITRKDKRGYLSYVSGTKSYYVHRLIWLYVHGEQPTLIDHIDRDRSNNRLTNLRETSRQENYANSNYSELSYEQRKNRNSSK